MNNEKRMCMDCGRLFNSSEMLKVGRKMYCKECSADLLEKNSEMANVGGRNGIHIVNNNAQIGGSEDVGISRPHKIVKRRYVVAILLSVFFGLFGVDRFYLNKIGTGVIKLLLGLSSFSVLSEPWNPVAYAGILWYLMDIILIATKNISYVEWE